MTAKNVFKIVLKASDKNENIMNFLKILENYSKLRNPELIASSFRVADGRTDRTVGPHF